MAEPTDFIDFSHWKDLTSASEERALRAQQGRVDVLAANATQYLNRASDEAERAQMREAQTGVAHTTLSTTGSYSDYLKAKQAVDNARALMMLGKTGEYGDVRSAVDAERGYSAGAQSSLDELQRRENMKGAYNDVGVGAQNRMAEQRRALEAKKAAELDARQRNDTTNRERFNADLLGRMSSDWARQDKFAGSFGVLSPENATGGFTIYGENMNPYAGDPDSQRLAQMARTQGFGAQADRYQSGATYEWGKRTKGGY